jgi:hypothetical protein
MLMLVLSPDAPQPFLDELRWHLGLTDTGPASPTMKGGGPSLVPNRPSYLPGGELAVLSEQRLYGNRPPLLCLFTRIQMDEEETYEMIQVVPSWLAPWSRTQGWIGYVREEMDLTPWMQLYVQDGEAYWSGDAGAIESLSGEAPPFTLTGTFII